VDREPVAHSIRLMTIMRFILLIVLISLLGPGDGKKKGRRGNALYEKEAYSDAAHLYQEALADVQEDGANIIHSRLLNNLGAALFRQGDFEQATAAFASSVRMSTENTDAVRALYNAGNAAAMQKNLKQALNSYQRALLADPDNEDAKYNYEFVKRQMEDQEKNQDKKQDKNKDQKQNQDPQQNQDQNKENQDQDQQQQNQDQNPNQDQKQDPQQSEQKPDPERLSKEEAQRILQAMENDEQQLLRQIQKMKARPRRVEKDW